MNDEITIIQIGNLYPDTPKFKNRTAGRVYDINGCCPTINTNGGGGREPMIVVYEDRPNNMLEQQGGGGYNQAYKIESTM